MFLAVKSAWMPCRQPETPSKSRPYWPSRRKGYCPPSVLPQWCLANMRGIISIRKEGATAPSKPSWLERAMGIEPTSRAWEVDSHIHQKILEHVFRSRRHLILQGSAASSIFLLKREFHGYFHSFSVVFSRFMLNKVWKRCKSPKIEACTPKSGGWRHYWILSNFWLITRKNDYVGAPCNTQLIFE